MGRRTHFFKYCINNGLVDVIEHYLAQQEDWVTTYHVLEAVDKRAGKLPLDIYRVTRIMQYMKKAGKVENKITITHACVWKLKIVN